MLKWNQSCVEGNNIRLKVYADKGVGDWAMLKDLLHCNTITAIVVSLIQSNISQGCLRVPSTYLLSCYVKIMWFTKEKIKVMAAAGFDWPESFGNEEQFFRPTPSCVSSN